MNVINRIKGIGLDFGDKRVRGIIKYALMPVIIPPIAVMLIFVINSGAEELKRESEMRRQNLIEFNRLLNELSAAEAKIAEALAGLPQAGGALTKEGILKSINDISARNGVYIRQISERGALRQSLLQQLPRWEFSITLNGSTQNILRVAESLSDSYAVKISEMSADAGNMSFVITFTDISEAGVP